MCEIKTSRLEGCLGLSIASGCRTPTPTASKSTESLPWNPGRLLLRPRVVHFSGEPLDKPLWWLCGWQRR